VSERLAPWERRHAILSHRAALLLDTAKDPGLPLSAGERRVLREVAAKLKAAAHSVLRSAREGGCEPKRS
jgi:hypothetical protein